MSVPFDFEPGFPEILVEWNAPDKSLLGTPGWLNNSCPKYCANRESVLFKLDEAIFEVSREAISI